MVKHKLLNGNRMMLTKERMKKKMPLPPETDEVSEIFIVMKISKSLAFQLGKSGCQTATTTKFNRKQGYEWLVHDHLVFFKSASIQFDLSTHFELIDNEMASGSLFLFR